MFVKSKVPDHVWEGFTNDLREAAKVYHDAHREPIAFPPTFRRQSLKDATGVVSEKAEIQTFVS